MKNVCTTAVINTSSAVQMKRALFKGAWESTYFVHMNALPTTLILAIRCPLRTIVVIGSSNVLAAFVFLAIQPEPKKQKQKKQHLNQSVSRHADFDVVALSRHSNLKGVFERFARVNGSRQY